MQSERVMRAFKNNIAAVIRIQDTALAGLVAQRAVDAGMNLIELTLSIDNAPELIRSMKKQNPDALIGAGTVLTLEQCRQVLDAGADFVVSPCTVEEVVRECVTRDVLCLPGAATATEVYSCYRMGCRLVKLFPGGVLGPGFIKDIKGPMPFLECMPSGGVSEDNLADWMRGGAWAVSVGSALYKDVTANSLELIDARVKTYFDRMKEAVQ